MTAAIVFGAPGRPVDRARLAQAALIQNPDMDCSGIREGPVDRTLIRRGARRAASVALVAAAVSLAVPAVASAAVQTNGLGGTGHPAQVNGISGSGHAVRVNGIGGGDRGVQTNGISGGGHAVRVNGVGGTG
jgi:hypothetical protein